MPCPHNEITIVQRSQRQSAVAAAAYQSGEKLFCEYDQQVKHYPEKRGIVHNEILLPANAPRSYADRNTLWNAAEAVEKQWNSQLARRWVLTIPREIPPDQYAVLVREFCEQQFVLSAKLDRIGADLEKARKKRAEWDAKVKDLERRYREEENSEIHEMVHAANLNPEQLSELLRMFAADMAPKPDTINTMNEEETQNEI